MPQSHPDVAVNVLPAEAPQISELKPASAPNAIYSFAVGGAVMDWIFINRAAMDPNIVGYVGTGAIVGAFPGIFAGAAIEMSVAHCLGRYTVISSSSFKKAISAGVSAAFAGALVNATEIMFVKAGYTEDQAKHMAPALIITTASVVRFGPAAVKQSAVSITNAASRFCAFFKRKNSTSPQAMTQPLLINDGNAPKSRP